MSPGEVFICCNALLFLSWFLAMGWGKAMVATHEGTARFFQVSADQWQEMSRDAMSLGDRAAYDRYQYHRERCLGIMREHQNKALTWKAWD